MARSTELTPSLRFDMQTHGIPRAATAMRLLSELTRAFEHYSAKEFDRTQAATLLIGDLRIGSVLATLYSALQTAKEVYDVAEAAKTLHDARGLIGGFVANINDAVSMLRAGGFPPALSASLRTFLRSSARAVEQRHAVSISISVTGNNNVVTIDPDTARLIAEALRPVPVSDAPKIRAERPAAGLSADLSVVRRAMPQLLDLENELPGGLRYAEPLADLTNVRNFYNDPPGPGDLMPNFEMARPAINGPTINRDTDSKSGSAVRTPDGWEVTDIPGLGGKSLPVLLGEDRLPKRRKACAVEGHVMRALDQPVGFDITHAVT